MKSIEIIDEEVTFKDLGVEDRSIISRTDLNGIITFANKAFCMLSGYEKNELLGKPHSIIRHPDMPRAAFKSLWDDVQSKGFWTGYVKNARKGGGFYWVYATVLKSVDKNGNTKYVSIRVKPSREDIKKAQDLLDFFLIID